MKASILIASYLLKDIWCRWLETPGAVAARVIVAALLALLMLFVQAAFVLAARSLESRVLAFGANVIAVTSTSSQQALADGRPPLAALLDPLRAEGSLLTLKLVFTAARTEYGTTASVLAYDDASLPGLAPYLHGPGEDGLFLLSDTLPPGLPVTCAVELVEFTALVRPLPAQFSQIVGQTDLLLVPEITLAESIRRGHQELALFTAHDANTTPALTAAIQALLAAEGIEGAQIRTAAGWLEELADLRSRQARWQATLATLCLAVLVLVFGSIALLEYRQNSFIAALLRSFGASRLALLARYLVEGLLLMALAATLALVGVRFAHTPLFTLAGFDHPWIDLTYLDPYRWQENLPLLAAFATAAVLGTLPVAWALRRPVGRVLG